MFPAVFLTTSSRAFESSGSTYLWIIVLESLVLGVVLGVVLEVVLEVVLVVVLVLLVRFEFEFDEPGSNSINKDTMSASGSFFSCSSAC